MPPMRWRMMAGSIFNATRPGKVSPWVPFNLQASRAALAAQMARMVRIFTFFPSYLVRFRPNRAFGSPSSLPGKRWHCTKKFLIFREWEKNHPGQCPEWLNLQVKSLTEFRQDAGIKSNPKKVAAQGELPKGQERVAWAMYVSFFSSQTGKCRSVKQNVPVAHFVA